MNLGRRTFLKLLGLAPVAPVAAEAVKAAEASPLLGVDLAMPGSEVTTIVPVYRMEYRGASTTFTRISTHHVKQFNANLEAAFNRHRSLMRDEG